MRRFALLGLSAVLVAGACETDDGVGPGRGGGAPGQVEASAAWTLDSWDLNSGRADGHPSVVLAWTLPSDWNGEAFRVYGRRSGQSRYTLAATVTSCAEDRCEYSDRNVSAGESYDYYLTAVDERTGRESEASAAVSVAVPAASTPATPDSVTAHGLDGGVFVRWKASGADRYVVYLQDGQDLFTIGETDGTGYLDLRAENGTVNQYRVAAVGSSGQYGNLTALVAGIPRPDYHAESLYAYGDSVELSGFRFQSSGNTDPVLRGDAATAHWRVEMVNGALSLRPLGQTQLTRGTDTSELTCGPGSDDDCVSVERAPAASSFQTGTVAAEPGFTYVFRVIGDDNRIHYGKVRVLGPVVTRAGKNALIFDWAYQLRAEEPSLNRTGGGGRGTGLVGG